MLGTVHVGRDEVAKTLIALLDMNRTVPMASRAFKFDIVLHGRHQTFFEHGVEGM